MSDVKKPVFNLQDNRMKKLQSHIEAEARTHGRVVPQAIELEKAVIGAVMLDKNATSTVMEILRVDSFYKQGHRLIYEAITDLYQAQEPVDLMTVVEKLKKKNHLEEAGGLSYIVHLSNMVASSANVEYHARIVAQKYIQRELITVSTQTVNDAFEDTKDVFEMLDSAEQGLYDITEKNMRKGYQKISELAGKVLKRIEGIQESGEDMTGTPSGFTQLDALTNGWQPSDLIILAARPGMGKTAFSLAIAKNAALNFQKSVAFFTLEMSSEQLVQRLISMEAGIDNAKLRTGKLEDHDWEKLHTALTRLGEANIFIDETPALNIFELRAKCRRLKTNHDISLIVIDYLQLMSGGGNNKGGNREQEISTISRSLKGLAKELHVPVIALSQLSRQVEMRANKRPVLSDLRESGAIEQDADIVTFLYRPGYYDDEEMDDVSYVPGQTEVIVAKHRNGATDTVNIRFVNEFARFEDMEEMGFIDPNDPTAPSNNFINRSSRMNDEDVIW